MAPRSFASLLLCVLGVVATPGVSEEIVDKLRGADLFRRTCNACHKVGEGAKHSVGPHLNGLFGRRAGSVHDYRYSDAMLQAGIDGLVWTSETLDQYLEKPRAFVRGTRMMYNGRRDPQDRADLMAYLGDFSDSPSNVAHSKSSQGSSDYSVDAEILAIEGDPEYGEYLSAECVACHTTSGSDEGIPQITQWPEEDFVVVMHAYKNKVRAHPVMQMMAGRLSDEEIAALAAYFAKIAP